MCAAAAHVHQNTRSCPVAAHLLSRQPHSKASASCDRAATGRHGIGMEACWGNGSVTKTADK